MSKKIAFCHPFGNPNVKNALLALEEKSLLDFLVTTLDLRNIANNQNIVKLFPKGIIRQINRRNWIFSRDLKVYSYPVLEIKRIVLNYLGVNNRLFFNKKEAVDKIFQDIDNKFAQHIRRNAHNLSAIYGYEDCSANSFKEAHKFGLMKFYDLPTLHYKKVKEIHQEEAKLYPEFKSSCKALYEPNWKIERKEEELSLADYIIVASTSTKNSLLENNVDPKKVKIIPYGCDLKSQPIFDKSLEFKKKFNLLYVGRLSPLKGIHYLLDAMEDLELSDLVLHLVGGNEYPKGYLEKRFSENERIIYHGNVSYHELSKYYQQADLFVFPSLYEGFGLVLLEAMGHSLPIISTRTGAAIDIIEDGKDGFLLEPRDVLGLKEKLLWCYENRSELEIIRGNLTTKAKLLSWNNYRSILGDFVLTN